MIKYQFILLNYGLVKINDSAFTKLEYTFSKKEQYVRTDRVTGVTPIQLFIPKNIINQLKVDYIYNEFEIEGEEVPDIKKPMNKKFKATKLTNLITKDVIDLSK